MLVDREQYQRLVRKLIYLSHMRLNIAYVVKIGGKFMHQPQKEHMEAAMRIIQNLKGTPGMGVLFGRNRHLDIEVFIGANCAKNPNGRPTLGYFALVEGNVVIQRSKN